MRRASLLQQLSRLGDFRPGSITATRGRCGNPGCRCYRHGELGHGPTLRLTYKVKGKTITEGFSSPAARVRIEREVAEFRRYQALTRALVEVNLEICRARTL